MKHNEYKNHVQSLLQEKLPRDFRLIDADKGPGTLKKRPDFYIVQGRIWSVELKTKGVRQEVEGGLEQCRDYLERCDPPAILVIPKVQMVPKLEDMAWEKEFMSLISSGRVRIVEIDPQTSNIKPVHLKFDEGQKLKRVRCGEQTDLMSLLYSNSTR